MLTRRKTFLFFAAFVVTGMFTVKAVEMPSRWDIALPEMEINNVSIHEDSLETAWQQITTTFNLRTILVTEHTTEKSPFNFDADKCTGKDLLDALIETYKGFMWLHDAATGVIWVCPQGSLNSVLETDISIPTDQWGVPMQTGILEPLSEISKDGISVRKMGTPYLNTFNYPVDVPKGTYRISDLLNLCCICDPSKSFYIKVYPTHITIDPFNLFSMHLSTPPAGALLFWRIHIGEPSEEFPSNQEIIKNLASADPHVRWAARGYLGGIRLSPEKLIQQSQSGEQALWVCVGTSNIYSRLGEATRMPIAVERLRKELTNESLIQNSSEAAIVALLALTKLDRNFDALTALARKESVAGDLSAVVSEVNYLVRTSPRLRSTLKNVDTKWLTAATPSLHSVENMSERIEMVLSEVNK